MLVTAVLDVEVERVDVDVKEAALTAGSQCTKNVGIACAVTEKLQQVGRKAHLLARHRDHWYPEESVSIFRPRILTQTVPVRLNIRGARCAQKNDSILRYLLR